MRALRLVVVNCLVFFALLEAAALIYYWQTSSGLFYLGSPAPEPRAIVAAVNDPAWRPRAHPYFGFVYVPDPGAQLYGLYVNNHAFVQSAAYVKANPLCCDFPAKRTDKHDFIIGIFGGSVAAGFAVATQEARDFQPIDGRNVRVLNFASGGYKQPQQLLVLSYFLSLGQTFDAIINIDGFNELLTDGQRGPDLSMPGGAWQALVAAIDKNGNRAALVPFVHEYLRRELLTSGDHCRIAVCWALYYFAARYVEHRRAALPVSHGNEPSFLSRPALPMATIPSQSDGPLPPC